MRRVAAVAILAALSACTPPAAPVPSPPPAAQLFRQDSSPRLDLVMADMARELHARGLRTDDVKLWRMPVGARFEAVRAYYAARLAGWALVAGFPNRVADARACAWRRGRDGLAISLIDQPVAGGPSTSPVTILTVVTPPAR